jgi:enoyl-CoA hydratase
MPADAPGVAAAGLRVEDLGDRVVVTLDRPERRNAIDAALVAALHRVCAGVEANPRPLVVTGGTEVFAAGADIRELRDRTRDDALAGINSTLFDRIAALPAVTVAAVAGPAIGGGAELAYACDFRVVTPTARFANPEAQLGILAAAGACWRLRELVGEPLAKEVLLAGRSIDAERALATGLANEIVAPEALLAAAHAWVDRTARAAPLALRLTKLALRAPRAAHPVFDDVAQAVLFETDEKRRRMDEFLNR